MGADERFESGDHDRNQRRFEQIIGNSPALESVLEQVERVAPTDSAVLIQGETGTGKELVARAIHIISERYERPFIKVNCAAIPFDLLESELFGHEKGALIDAITQQIGRFEMANKGTLFLDEVGDIPLALQPKLLRALQKQEFERLGSTRTHHVNVRLGMCFQSLCHCCGRAAKTFRPWWRILSSFIAAGWAIKSNAFLRKRCLHSARISGRETFASSKISSNGA